MRDSGRITALQRWHLQSRYDIYLRFLSTHDSVSMLAPAVDGVALESEYDEEADADLTAGVSYESEGV